MLPIRDVVTWNALINGYVKAGHSDEAWRCFDQMMHHHHHHHQHQHHHHHHCRGGICPNAVTIACMLKACIVARDMRKGEEMYATAVKAGFDLVDANPFVASLIIGMYTRCGSIESAQAAFDKFHRSARRSRAVWNSLVCGYAAHGHGGALDCFDEMMMMMMMQDSSASSSASESSTSESSASESSSAPPPNAITFAASLRACASNGACAKGCAIHAEAARRGLVQGSIFVGTALVSMYAKCGELAKAREVFDSLPERNVVTWGALIDAYSRHGSTAEDSLALFEDMLSCGQCRPDRAVLVSVLQACSHSGMIDTGFTCFQALILHYGMLATVEHHTALIDLLARAGQLGLALGILARSPFSPTHAMWLTLLGACKKWHDVEVGELAFQHATRSNEENDAAYVCMYNIYSCRCCWHGSKRMMLE
jgi:pentatricopeptide repeat protein